MRVLNLSPGFEPFSEYDSVIPIRFKTFTFPDGSPHIKIELEEHEIEGEVVSITQRIKNMNDLMLVLLAREALDRFYIDYVNLVIPYVPFSRQDRIMVPGEPLSIKVFSNLINDCGFSNVTIFDPHSDVTPGLLDNCDVITNHSFVKEVLLQYVDNFILAFPDAGALKKAYPLLSYLGYRDKVILGTKHRDLATGDIAGISVDILDCEGKDVFIIDDILSKGGTFVGLAKELKKRNCGNIYLIVSHTDGNANLFNLLSSGIEHIYTTNSTFDYPDNHYITQIPIKL